MKLDDDGERAAARGPPNAITVLEFISYWLWLNQVDCRRLEDQISATEYLTLSYIDRQIRHEPGDV